MNGVPRPRGDGPLASALSFTELKRSPPARGWPGGHCVRVRGPRAFPARAGMARSACRRPPAARCVPRPRGDGPSNAAAPPSIGSRSPPARGWPDHARLYRREAAAFPARAGMARRAPKRRRRSPGVPRPRGDGPARVEMTGTVDGRSPPARGWPDEQIGSRVAVAAFPARAGMARTAPVEPAPARRVPRPRGDGPSERVGPSTIIGRSPPARGWPVVPALDAPEARAFPARAGMARRRRRRIVYFVCVPRPRGDGPVCYLRSPCA